VLYTRAEVETAFVDEFTTDPYITMEELTALPKVDCDVDKYSD
jgi:hypothetical protein